MVIFNLIDIISLTMNAFMEQFNHKRKNIASKKWKKSVCVLNENENKIDLFFEKFSTFECIEKLYALKALYLIDKFNPIRENWIKR